MSNPYLGEIRIFAGNFAPRSWAFCNGQLLSIAQNEALYTLIGTTYGGDGITTFGLPNMQGRVAVGQGQGPGLSMYVLGEMAGTESVTITQNSMPSHNHNLIAYNVDATDITPGPALALSNPLNSHTGVASLWYLNLNGGPNNPVMAADTVMPTGGSQPHDNTAPSLVLNYIIALEGVFPSRN